MTIFRPCIDLHSGQVKQIVGGTLKDTPADVQTNYVSSHPSAFYSRLYREHDLRGGHVIMLGPNNEEAAKEALAVWPGALQIGGGINEKNAQHWIEAGAEKVIITSYLFPNGTFSQERLDAVLESLDNNREKLVIDLSCRRKDDTWFVAMNKWQTITDFEITAENLKKLESYCSEFLIHAADHEGLQRGIDEDLLKKLAFHCSVPITYAGGARNIQDLELVKEISHGKVDLTIGSALDIFGGSSVTLQECVEWNKHH